MDLKAVGFLVVAALLEVLGDAAMRAGIARSPWWIIAGAASLTAYGFIVNADRRFDFGRLLGAYIAVFFVVTQVVAVFVFHERVPPSRLVGGLLIALGGIIVFVGAK